MRLEDCVLEGLSAGINPSAFKGPSESWMESIKNGFVPKNVYNFYSNTDYFAINKVPKYLHDPEKLLYVYIKYCLEGIKSNFEEAFNQKELIFKYEDEKYNPLKEFKREKWDKDASKKQQRCFQYLLLNLSGILDQFSEIVSILFFGIDNNLNPGCTDFIDILKIRIHKEESNCLIIAPKKKLLIDIRETISKDLSSEGEEKGWFDLFKLYRNKLTHIGGTLCVIACHDTDGKFFTFLQRSWPYFFEQDIDESIYNKHLKNDDFKENVLKIFIHQDIVSYSNSLYEKIFLIIDHSFEKLTMAYQLLQNFEYNQDTFNALNSNSCKNIRFISFREE